MSPSPSLAVAALALVALALLIAAYLTGPRARVVGEPEAAEPPDDIDAWLAARESLVPDLVPGAEARILWADPERRQRTAWCVVAIHGFSASRQETAPLAESMARALGANLFEPRLRGHGRTELDALGKPTAMDWLADAVEALAIGRRVGERVLLLGTSTGGTLGTWLAATGRIGERDALVLISPNYRLPDPRARMLLWPRGKLLARLVEGEHRAWEPHNPEHERYWTTRYPSRALVELASLMAAVEELDLGAMNVPTLVLYGPHDTIVDPRRTVERFPEMGGSPKRLVALQRGEDPDGHVMAGAILSPSGTDEVLGEVRAFVASLPDAPTWDGDPAGTMEGG